MSPLFRRRGASAPAGISEVSATDAGELLDQGAILVDVREPFEWTAGHAPAARHIPGFQLQSLLESLPSDRQIIVACRSGNRSAQATALLAAAGLHAVNLAGGMQAWARAGLSIVTDSGQPGRVA